MRSQIQSRFLAQILSQETVLRKDRPGILRARPSDTMGQLLFAMQDHAQLPSPFQPGTGSKGTDAYLQGEEQIRPGPSWQLLPFGFSLGRVHRLVRTQSGGRLPALLTPPFCPPFPKLYLSLLKGPFQEGGISAAMPAVLKEISNTRS